MPSHRELPLALHGSEQLADDVVFIQRGRSGRVFLRAIDHAEDQIRAEPFLRPRASQSDATSTDI